MAAATLVPFCDIQVALRLGQINADQISYYTFLQRSAEAAIQRLCGRKFLPATYTDILDSIHTDTLTLRETPVASITSLYQDQDRVFGSDTLVDPTKYALKLDGYSGNSESGIVYRIDGLWTLDGGDWSWRPPQLSRRQRRIPQCIKVVYVAGYNPTPYDLREAVIQTVAYLSKANPNGASRRSDSHEGFTYSIATPDEEVKRIGSVAGVIRTYRRLPV